jgi:hypothetical protein
MVSGVLGSIAPAEEASSGRGEHPQEASVKLSKIEAACIGFFIF